MQYNGRNLPHATAKSEVILMRATVDRDLCIGCGLCEDTCPGVFELDDEMISTVMVDEIPASLEECATEAEANCPVTAITLE